MYLLISVYERDIVTKRFNNYYDAFKQMKKELSDQVKEYLREEELNFALYEIACGYVTDDDMFGLGETWAWSNCDDDYNCDWKIVEI